MNVVHRCAACAMILGTVLIVPATGRGQMPGRTAPDTIRMVLAWEIAPDKSPIADSLGQLSGVTVDARGNAYVTDFSAVRIWVFDPQGRPLPPIGRKGRGPGEFESPTGPAVGSDGRLYVRDLSRVTRFALDARTNLLARYDTAFLGPAMSDWRSMRATRFDGQGRLYYPAFNLVDRSSVTGWYLRYNQRGERIDSVVVPAFPGAPAKSTAFFRTGPTGGRMVRGLNYAPFAPLPVWDVTARGTLITGTGREYLLEERDTNGRIIRTFRRDVPADRIPNRERAESLAALEARLDSVSVPLDRVEGMPPEVRRRQLPTAYPPYMAIHAVEDGTLWVRRWPVGGPPRSVYDVFDAAGQFIAVVILPRVVAVEPPPRLHRDYTVAVGIDVETGANVVYGLRRSAR